MANFFKRSYRLVIGTNEEAIEIRDLRVTFEITKSLIGFPNTARIVAYNLKQSNRNKIKEEYKKISLYAGYENNETLVFTGDIKNVNHFKSPTDWISEIFAGDGASDLESAKINKSYTQGSTVESLFNDLVKQMPGIAKGKLDGIKECLKKKRSILKTAILSGSVKEFLDKIAETCGFDYSVNDGVIDTVPKGKAITSDPTIIINQTNGMIGSPEITEIGANVTTYLNSSAKVGRLFKIESISAKINVGNQLFREVKKTTEGTFRINKLTHKGDTHGDEWSTSYEGAKIG